LESISRPQGEEFEFLWWEFSICRVVKFIKDLGKIVVCSRKRDLRVARKRVEEVRIFLEEDISNLSLQEEVAKIEHLVRSE
jgi:hypothetical protein